MGRKPFGKSSSPGLHRTFPRRPPCTGLFGDGNLFANHREAPSVAVDCELESPPGKTCSPSRGTIPFRSQIRTFARCSKTIGVDCRRRGTHADLGELQINSVGYHRSAGAANCRSRSDQFSPRLNMKRCSPRRCRLGLAQAISTKLYTTQLRIFTEPKSCSRSKACLTRRVNRQQQRIKCRTRS